MVEMTRTCREFEGAGRRGGEVLSLMGAGTGEDIQAVCLSACVQTCRPVCRLKDIVECNAVRCSSAVHCSASIERNTLSCVRCTLHA